MSTQKIESTQLMGWCLMLWSGATEGDRKCIQWGGQFTSFNMAVREKPHLQGNTGEGKTDEGG